MLDALHPQIFQSESRGHCSRCQDDIAQHSAIATPLMVTPRHLEDQPVLLDRYAAGAKHAEQCDLVGGALQEDLTVERVLPIGRPAGVVGAIEGFGVGGVHYQRPLTNLRQPRMASDQTTAPTIAPIAKLNSSPTGVMPRHSMASILRHSPAEGRAGT